MEEQRSESRNPQDPSPSGQEAPSAPDGIPPKDPTKKGSRDKVKIRFKVKGERSGQKSRKKAKSPGGIDYSSGKDSTFAKGNTFFLVAILIVGGCLIMAYLVLAKLGAPPPLPSD